MPGQGIAPTVCNLLLRCFLVRIPREGESLFYPFYEYEREEHFEYSPADFGINNDADFVGVGNLNEFLIFAAIFAGS